MDVVVIKVGGGRMTNREKFREVFNKDIYWSRALEPQILALKSAHIDGIDCMEEWLNSEYTEPPIIGADKESESK